jgi:hypothetical protein
VADAARGKVGTTDDPVTTDGPRQLVNVRLFALIDLTGSPSCPQIVDHGNDHMHSSLPYEIASFSQLRVSAATPMEVSVH